MTPQALFWRLWRQGAIADRNHDGVVDAKDIEIRAPGDGVNVVVADIFDAERGIVSFNVSSGINRGTFKVRYATSSRELTWAKATVTKTFVINDGKFDSGL